ncbi:hypothetical protein CQA89_26065, partial [Klebsiella pneumoniae]
MSLPSRLPAILQAVMQGQPQALADSHYPQWHLAPVNGLLNDPNGFCQVAGRYHLFYQWNPLACDHTYKCWGHWSSADLLHWRHEPIALMPDEEYDRNGCYSGSAVEFEGALTDLLHWRHEPIALMPDEEYDRNGCYSGSAVEFE